MNAVQPVRSDLPELQLAIYGVALSLESYVLNGILYGILTPNAGGPGFLKKVEGNLLRELRTLEGQPKADDGEGVKGLVALRDN